eukprot:c7337_g1_i1.p1 GENE.c7337_g1_i1~~c7337_g1_i1.p1  ORF type:complete len:381 (+),score=62.73 c7337_g1_i1:231-1373(+)
MKGCNSKQGFWWFLLNARGSNGLSELLFVRVTGNMVQLPEFKLLDIFDLLADATEDCPGFVGFSEFHMFISFLCSLESAQMSHFVFLYCHRLFQVLEHSRTFSPPRQPGSAPPPPIRYSAVSVGALWRLLAPLQLPEDFFNEFVRDASTVNQYQSSMATAWSEAALEEEAFHLMIACIADDWDTQHSKRSSNLRKRGESMASARKTATSVGNAHEKRPTFDDKDTDDVDALDVNEGMDTDASPAAMQVAPLAHVASRAFDDEMDLLQLNTPKPFSMRESSNSGTFSIPAHMHTSPVHSSNLAIGDDLRSSRGRSRSPGGSESYRGYHAPNTNAVERKSERSVAYSAGDASLTFANSRSSARSGKWSQPDSGENSNKCVVQ